MIAKRNRRLLLCFGVFASIVAIIYFISVLVGGPFHEFCKGAVNWVLLGVGVACALSYTNIDK